MAKESQVKIGEKYGMLTVISGPVMVKWELHVQCVCDCGGSKLTNERSMLKGRVKSCGCFRRNKNKKQLAHA